MKDRHTINTTCSKRKTEEVEGYRLTYELTEASSGRKNGSIFSVTVKIEKGAYHDEMTAFDITRNRNRAEHIFKLLCVNTVTPCTLIDVLSDIL